MQCAMSVSLLLLITACVSRGTWAVITLRGYVDITCVMSVVSKSPLPFILSHVVFGGEAEDRKQHLDYTGFVACV